MIHSKNTRMRSILASALAGILTFSIAYSKFESIKTQSFAKISLNIGYIHFKSAPGNRFYFDEYKYRSSFIGSYIYMNPLLSENCDVSTSGAPSYLLIISCEGENPKRATETLKRAVTAVIDAHLQLAETSEEDKAKADLIVKGALQDGVDALPVVSRALQRSSESDSIDHQTAEKAIEIIARALYVAGRPLQLSSASYYARTAFGFGATGYQSVQVDVVPTRIKEGSLVIYEARGSRVTMIATIVSALGAFALTMLSFALLSLSRTRREI